jgi:hypothetical protein
MADINFEGTNLLGEPFKEYVDDQIKTRQSILGKLNKSNKDIVWENGKSAYVALASSIDVSNTSTTLFTRVNSPNSISTPSISTGGSSFEFDSTFNTPTITTSAGEIIDSFSNPNSEGTKKIKSLGLPGDPNQYLDNFLANNLVLFGGTAYYEIDSSGSYSNPYYRSGLATSDSILNNSAYGFGGTSFGLAPLPGIASFNLKSKNMGSLREATITLRANSDDQFKLIDTLYCRIGYTMFLEWGNSVYYNNNDNYVSNPPSEGVTSLIPLFLSKNTKGKLVPGNTTLEDPNKFLELIEKRRKQSNGNYDAFFGKVKNFSWEFNKAGYYEISLSLISQGDIIESLTIDGQYGNVIDYSNIQSDITQVPPDNSSALTSFLSVVAEPSEKKVNTSGGRGGLITNIDRQIYKTTLIASSSIINQQQGFNSPLIFSQTSASPSDTISPLNYTRLSGSLGKIVSATAQFGSDHKEYYYIRLGDILDFIKDRLLIYNTTGNNEPILDIDTDTDHNLMYCSNINMSADPSKVMVRTELPYSTAGLLRISQFSATINQESVFDDPGKAELEQWKSTSDPNDPTQSYPLHGKIMNIYFEYQYLLDVIQNLRDEDYGFINLYDFVNELCQTANNCLGGVNKLAIRLEDDKVMRIYDQIPIYGTQVTDSSNTSTSNILNLYGIQPTTNSSGSITERDGSFVTDFSIKTELTNDFATLVTIGAQAQGSTINEDSTGLSAWNNGLEDRWFPKKIDSLRKDNNVQFPTIEERIDNLTQQLKILWLGYASGRRVKRTNLPNIVNNIYTFNDFPKPSKYQSLVKLQKDWLHQLIIYENQLINTARVINEEQELGTNQIGMIPLNISVTMDGLSGIKIYNRLQVDFRFLPSYYPRTLIWVIKGVSHEIINNKWFTKLETLAYPKLPEKQVLKELISKLSAPSITSSGSGASPPPGSLVGNSSPTPNADIVGVTEKNIPGYAQGELSSGGDISSELVNLIKAVFIKLETQINANTTLSNLWNTTIVEITAGNDNFHQLNLGSATSRHKSGNALDLAVNDPTLRLEVDKILSGITLGTPNVSYINEYDYPGTGINKNHFHLAFGSPVGSALLEFNRAENRFNNGEINKITLTF